MPDTIYLNGNSYDETSFQGQAYADSDTGFLPALTDIVAHCQGIFRGSSTSTLTVGNGAKSLTVSLNRPIYVNSWVRVEARANAAIAMEGPATAYNPDTGALTITVDPSDVSGAGTLSDWVILTMGRRGKDGNAGTLATNSVAGVAALATQAEVDARNNTGKIVTPATLAEGTGLKGVDIASASTLTLPATGDYFHVTGTTGVGAISTRAAGRVVALRFAGAVTITHNATSMILPGATNITTKADDVLTFVSEGSGNWRCVTGAQAASQAEADARASTAKALTPAVVAGGTGLKGTDIASASTLTLPTVGDFFHVTGTTGIGALSARTAGRVVTLRFVGSLVLTSSGNLILGGGNITTTADAVAVFVSEGGGVWRLSSYRLGSPVYVPGLALLSRQVISSAVAQVDETSVFTNSFCDHFRVVFSLVQSQASSVKLRWGSGSFETTGYYWTLNTNGGGVSSGTNAGDVVIGGGGSLNAAVHGEIVIERPQTSISRTLRWDASWQVISTSGVDRAVGAAARSSGTLDRIRLFPDAGNFSSGVLSVYGVRNA
ncbi:MAG: hypothetical protein ACOVN0_18275 [Niveispirillum sp.]|uniref:hypothetical protein n=1 Tax=Niveispirillum sp. TaxID=1917217 RepID=UPI003BA50C2E